MCDFEVALFWLPDGEGAFDMLSLFLLPGDKVCDWAGVPAESEHRQVLRSFINMMVWSAVAIGVTVWVMV